jgi:hypothetical protein
LADDEQGGESIPSQVVAGEFHAEDRTNQHRVVATAMLVTFGVIFISQGWWKKIQDFVAGKTHGTTVAPPGG